MRDIDLTKLDEDELIELNRRVVEVTSLGRARSYQAMAQLNIGDTVSFTLEGGRVIVGTVARLNQKTVTVAAKDGHSWRVAPAFLSRVAEGESARVEQGVLVSLESRTRGRR